MSVVRINGVPITNVSMGGALDLIGNAIADGTKRCVFFVNADCLNISARDSEYHRTLNRDDALVFGDGAGVRFAGRVSRQPVVDNVNGTDMFPTLCGRAAARGWRLFLLGAKPGVAEAVAERMSALHPGLEFAGTRDGYFHDATAVIEEVNEARPDLLLVALGAPRQERFIAAHRTALNAPVAMGVGGLFDFYSGRIPRAPRLVRDASMEWAWRLAMEPRRLWRRYLIGNFTFMGRVLWWQVNGRNAP